MARGRPAVPKAPTKFMNKKHRVIMMTANGKYVVKTGKGMAYNPKAAYVKSPGGTVRTLTNSGARVPTAIRPKATRKRRVNAGKARGPRAGVKAGDLARLFASPKASTSPIGLAGMKIMMRRGRPMKVHRHIITPGGSIGLAGMKIMKRRGRPVRVAAMGASVSPIGLAGMKIMMRRGRPVKGRRYIVTPGSPMGLAAMKIMHKRGRHAKMPAGAGARIDAMLRSMTPK